MDGSQNVLEELWQVKVWHIHHIWLQCSHLMSRGYIDPRENTWHSKCVVHYRRCALRRRFGHVLCREFCWHMQQMVSDCCKRLLQYCTLGSSKWGSGLLVKEREGTFGLLCKSRPIITAIEGVLEVVVHGWMHLEAPLVQV